MAHSYKQTYTNRLFKILTVRENSVEVEFYAGRKQGMIEFFIPRSNISYASDKQFNSIMMFPVDSMSLDVADWWWQQKMKELGVL